MGTKTTPSASWFFRILDSYIRLIVVRKSYKKVFFRKAPKRATSININIA